MNQTQLTKEEEIEAVMLAGMSSRIDLNSASSSRAIYLNKGESVSIATKEDVKTIEEEYIKEYYLPNDGTNMVIYRKKRKQYMYTYSVSQLVQIMIAMALFIICAFVAGNRLTDGRYGELIYLCVMGIWAARMMMDTIKEGETEYVETQKPS